jgi:protein-S-isoprenylcysteine O-methyltransferase Ste14
VIAFDNSAWCQSGYGLSLRLLRYNFEEEVVSMKQWGRRTGIVVWIVASILLVIAWIVSWYLTRANAIRALWYVGWVVWIAGAVLIVLPLLMIYGGRMTKSEKGWFDAVTIIDRGIYAVVRHPLYLGWMLMYVVVILFGQHWVTLLMGIVGIVCVYLISLQEEQRLIERLGEDYVRYLQKVPRLNIFLGIIRVLQGRKKK